MRLEEIHNLVKSTSIPAFAADGEGLIVAWNGAAEKEFGTTAEKALGQFCGTIVQGRDECGPVCSEHCPVRHSVAQGQPMGEFDLQAGTGRGQRWLSVAVLTAYVNGSSIPFAIHLMTPVEVRKRLEMVIRDFVISNTGLPLEQVKAVLGSQRSAARETRLSERELEILRLLAKGGTTSSIANQLHISRDTVSNHIQHILGKLNVHTRLEAIRRAEHARLI